MIWLFDTNACIAYLKRTSDELVARVEAADPAEIGWCAVVRFELYYGAFKGSRRNENLALLAKLFARFPTLVMNDSVAEAAGQIRAELERVGMPIGPYDLLIAATALVNDLTLVTRNTGEFSRIPSLRIENWEVS